MLGKSLVTRRDDGEEASETAEVVRHDVAHIMQTPTYMRIEERFCDLAIVLNPKNMGLTSSG